LEKQKVWRDYFENILVAVFLALIVRSFVLTGYKVPTGSMAPTLKSGDYIFTYKIPYGIKIPLTRSKIAVRSPQRGDVVVFTYPEQPRTNYVKRVVGVAGDLIKIENNILHVNGSALKYETLPNEDISEIPNFESLKVQTELAPEGPRKILSLNSENKKSFGPIVVPPGEVFLLGDHRDASDDSRYWGTVPIERVEGKVVLIWMSVDWAQQEVRWDRFFTRPL
jgi:signal peptidase I